VVAISGEGTTELKARMLAVADGLEQGGFALALDEVVEQAITDLEPTLAELPAANRRWLSIKLIENIDNDKELETPVQNKLSYWRRQIADRAGEETDILIADTRYGHAHALAQTVSHSKGNVTRTLSDRIDRMVLGKWTGIPLFLVIMYLMFLFTMNIGGAFIDFFDGASNALFVAGLGELLSGLGAPDWLRVFLADGVGGGVQIVATFIPIIAALYLFLSVLEDSGYMARAAFVMDHFMRTIGLPGKAFVPLIVGFGCNVPAIMATRTLENERERKLTILMNPFMSCGARLPVYALFAAAFFPSSGQNIVFALYLTGIAVAIVTGLLMKSTLLPGKSSGFMMELPPYHLPTLKGISLRAWDRVRLFVKEAGQIIILMVLALNLLNSIGTDGSFGNEDSEKSVLSAASRVMTPAFAPMGIQENNWPAVVGVFSGILAKEVVVGTLNNLYSSLATDAAAGEEADFDLWQQLKMAAASVPENLAAVSESLLDPIGLNIGDVSDISTAAEEQDINQGVFGAMNSRFDGQAGAFAYLLFVLLYFPCVATIGAIKREAGRPWAIFVAAWTTTVAYITAVSFYQVATYSDHPTASIAWLVGLWGSFTLLIYLLRRWGQREQGRATQPARAQA
jgi:ferrous iron transport protein B